MAVDANSARCVAWNTEYEKYLNLTQQLDDCPAERREALERAIADQEDDLLSTSAPSFDAVRIKMELLFEGQLLGLDPETEYRRLLLEDLSDLIAEGQELIGARA
ncbi:MAG TPA: hypothetical protein VFT61_08575 [Sphingomicrobium sp.]|nr:hypothetical protein [Sphingomicrobium sp.]